MRCVSAGLSPRRAGRQNARVPVTYSPQSYHPEASRRALLAMPSLVNGSYQRFPQIDSHHAETESGDRQRRGPVGASGPTLAGRPSLIPALRDASGPSAEANTDDEDLQVCGPTHIRSACRSLMQSDSPGALARPTHVSARRPRIQLRVAHPVPTSRPHSIPIELFR